MVNWLNTKYKSISFHRQDIGLQNRLESQAASQTNRVITTFSPLFPAQPSYDCMGGKKTQVVSLSALASCLIQQALLPYQTEGARRTLIIIRQISWISDDCRLSYRLWNSVLSESPSLLALSLWLKKTFNFASGCWEDRIVSRHNQEGTLRLCCLSVNLYHTPTHVSSAAARVLFFSWCV